MGACLLCGVVGCFEPQIRDGQIACELDESCPTGFVCIDNLCRNTAPGGKGDDPGDSDGGVADPGPDGSIPLGPGPKLYSHDGARWSAVSAPGYFAGSAINTAAIQTSFAYCDGVDIRCWADASVVACDFGNGPVDTTYSELGGNGLADFSPLFSSVFAIGNGGYDHLFHRGKEWRGYVGPVMELSNNQISANLDLYANSDGGGDPDLEDFYGNEPGAPASFDEIVWDYIDVTTSGDPLNFVRATGQRFVIDINGDGHDGGMVPQLADPGGPMAADIRAGFQCGSELVVYAVN